MGASQPASHHLIRENAADHSLREQHVYTAVYNVHELLHAGIDVQ